MPRSGSSCGKRSEREFLRENSGKAFRDREVGYQKAFRIAKWAFFSWFFKFAPFSKGKQLDLKRFTRETGVFAAFWKFCTPVFEKSGVQNCKKPLKTPKGSFRCRECGPWSVLRGTFSPKRRKNARLQEISKPNARLQRTSSEASKPCRSAQAQQHPSPAAAHNPCRSAHKSCSGGRLTAVGKQI